MIRGSVVFSRCGILSTLRWYQFRPGKPTIFLVITLAMDLTHLKILLRMGYFWIIHVKRFYFLFHQIDTPTHEIARNKLYMTSFKHLNLSIFFEKSADPFSPRQGGGDPIHPT